MSVSAARWASTGGTWIAWALAPLAVACLCLGGVGCKKKPPKLTNLECQTFCERLVPCFAHAMGEHAKDRESETAECIRDCRGEEGQKHGHILRAMKECGHLTDCEALKKCFEKQL